MRDWRRRVRVRSDGKLKHAPRFLIVDGYTKDSRDEFDAVGMKHGAQLVAEMLQRWLPGAESVVWLASDDPAPPERGRSSIAGYFGRAAI